MRKAQFFVVFLAFISLTNVTGCATNKVTEREFSSYQQSAISSDYPASRFLTAQGQGDSAQEAGDNARLNLAKIFSVRITGQQQSFRQVNSEQTDSGESVQVSYALSNRIEQQTDQLIEGSEVIFFYDEIEKKHKALATLEKIPAAQRLRQQIDQLDEQTEDYLKETSSDALLIMANNYRALQLQLLANNRRRQLAIVRPSAARQPSWQTQKLRRNLISQLQKISFKTKTENLNKDDRQLVFSALAKAGIERLEQDEADYLMTISWRIEEPFKRDNWFWQTAGLRFSIGDSISNNKRGGWLWNVKVSATEKSLLPGRMKNAVQQKIEKELLFELLQIANKSLPDQI